MKGKKSKQSKISISSDQRKNKRPTRDKGLYYDGKPKEPTNLSLHIKTKEKLRELSQKRCQSISNLLDRFFRGYPEEIELFQSLIDDLKEAQNISEEMNQTSSE